MKSIHITTGPDQKLVTLNFPDETPDAVIQKAMERDFGTKSAPEPAQPIVGAPPALRKPVEEQQYNLYPEQLLRRDSHPSIESPADPRKEAQWQEYFKRSDRAANEPLVYALQYPELIAASGGMGVGGHGAPRLAAGPGSRPVNMAERTTEPPPERKLPPVRGMTGRVSQDTETNPGVWSRFLKVASSLPPEEFHAVIRDLPLEQKVEVLEHREAQRVEPVKGEIEKPASLTEKPASLAPEPNPETPLSREPAENRAPEVEISTTKPAEVAKVEPQKAEPAADKPSEPSIPLWEQSIEELSTAADVSKQADRDLLVSLFGADGAKKYRNLEARANSMDPTRADAAYEELTRMEGGLTVEQQNRLHGVGEAGPSHEIFVAFRKALEGVEGDTPQELGQSLRWAFSALGDRKVDLSKPEKMTSTQQERYAQLRYGFEIADQRGWDKNEVLQAGLQAAATRFQDPEDAAFMLERFIRTTKPPPKPQAARLAVPAPVPEASPAAVPEAAPRTAPSAKPVEAVSEEPGGTAAPSEAKTELEGKYWKPLASGTPDETIGQRLSGGRTATVGILKNTETGETFPLSLRPDNSTTGSYSVVAKGPGGSQSWRMMYQGGSNLADSLGHFVEYMNTDSPGLWSADITPARPPARPAREKPAPSQDQSRLAELKQMRFKTAMQEHEIALLEARAKADPSKWALGNGVGRRVFSGGKTAQINRGFRVEEVDPENKMALIRQVADTGLTTSGGNADKIEPEWVHIADLVRDKKFDAPEPTPPPAAPRTETAKAEDVAPSQAKEEIAEPLRVPIVFGRNKLRGKQTGALVEGDIGSLDPLKAQLREEARKFGIDPTPEWVTSAVGGLLRAYEKSHAEWQKTKGDTIGFMFEGSLPSGRKILMGEPSVVSRTWQEAKENPASEARAMGAAPQALGTEPAQSTEAASSPLSKGTPVRNRKTGKTGTVTGVSADMVRVRLDGETKDRTYKRGAMEPVDAKDTSAKSVDGQAERATNQNGFPDNPGGPLRPAASDTDYEALGRERYHKQTPSQREAALSGIVENTRAFNQEADQNFARGWMSELERARTATKSSPPPVEVTEKPVAETKAKRKRKPR